MPIYGDQQAQLTMNRAAYGDVPAAMISGANTTYGGAAMGMNNMMSDVGQFVMPAMYTPPARMHIGSQGMVQQHTGLMRGLFGMVGMGPQTPSGTTHMEFGMNNAADVGERVGSGAAAVAGLGAGLAVGATAGRMIGTGAGAAIGSLLGPAGTVVGAAVGGFVGGAAAMMVTEMGISGGVNQRREIQNFLASSSSRFVGAGSDMASPRSGSGMSRGARSDIAEFIRGEDVADPMFDTGELTNILKQGTQLGMFTGTQDMDDFKSKFKDIVKNVKSVTRVLHQTLEEGMKTLKDLKTIGVGPEQAGAAVQQADALGKVAGRTGAEMIAAGMQGAELFRGTGVDMSIGFQSNQMNLASIRASRDAGALAQEAIAQAGGEEALAQRMTASGMAFSQSMSGRGQNAQFFTGGGFNQQSFMGNMMSGGGNFVQNAQTSAANLSSPAALIAFQANQEKFLSDMGKTMGGRGLQFNQLASAASQAEFLASSTGASTEDAFRLTLKQQGKSVSEIDAHIAEMKSAGSGFGANQAGAGASRDKLIIEQARENFVFNRIGASVGDFAKSVTDYVSAPLNRMIDAAGEGATSIYEEQVLGVQRANVRGIELGGTSAADLKRFKARRKGPVDLDVGGLMATTAGEDLANALESGALKGFGVSLDYKNPNVIGGQRPGVNDVILNDIGGSGRVETITQGEMAVLAKARQRFNVTTRQAEKMLTAGDLDDVTGGIGDALLGGKLSSVESTDDLVKAAFGKGVKEVSRDEIAKLRTQVKGTRFEKMLDETSKGLGIAGNAQEAAGVADLQSLQSDFKNNKETLAESLGFGGFLRGGSLEFASGVAEKISRAMAEDDPGKKAELLKEAGKAQLASGTPSQEVEKMLSGAQNGGKGVMDAAAELRSTVAGIGQTQVSRGSKVMSDIIKFRMEKSDLEVSEIKRVERIAGSIEEGGLLTLGEDDRDFLKKTGLATDVMGRMDKVAELDAAAKAGKVSKVEKILKEDMGLKGTKLKDALDRATSGDVQGVIKDLNTEFSSQLAGERVASAAGGGDVGGDGQGTAQQVFIQQSSVNTQVLAVLQGLAARLGVQ